MRAVVLETFNTVVVRIYERRFADIALFSFRIVVMLVGVRVVRAVVASVADSVVVSVRLIQISVFVFYIRIVAYRISILTHNNSTV